MNDEHDEHSSKVDKRSRGVTNFFMIAAIIVMLALAWSVA